MSDQYVIFIEVHSHNVRHFFHQQRRAVIRYDRNTGYFETVSLRVLLELIQPDLDIKTIFAELVYVFLDVFNLAFHAFAVFCYVLDRPYRTVLYFFEITFGTFQFRLTFFGGLALSESISLWISFRILGRNSSAHNSFKLPTI